MQNSIRKRKDPKKIYPNSIHNKNEYKIFVSVSNI